MLTSGGRPSTTPGGADPDPDPLEMLDPDALH
jgi:hypothetical protein